MTFRVEYANELVILDVEDRKRDKNKASTLNVTLNVNDDEWVILGAPEGDQNEPDPWIHVRFSTDH
ncbi:hypothetical protein ACJ72_07251, partial [Emergomyces africanus]